jgi:hypothetical protein
MALFLAIVLGAAPALADDALAPNGLQIAVHAGIAVPFGTLMQIDDLRVRATEPVPLQHLITSGTPLELEVLYRTKISKVPDTEARTLFGLAFTYTPWQIYDGPSHPFVTACAGTKSCKAFSVFPAAVMVNSIPLGHGAFVREEASFGPEFFSFDYPGGYQRYWSCRVTFAGGFEFRLHPQWRVGPYLRFEYAEYLALMQPGYATQSIMGNSFTLAWSLGFRGSFDL